MNAIPLAGPDGTVYAYACGRCRRVARGISRMVDTYDDEIVADMAEHSRADAESCCTCQKCKGVREGAGLFGASFLCAACEAADAPLREARIAEARKRIEALVERNIAAIAEVGRSVSTAVALRRLMSDMSEEHCCAGWLDGTEYVLWSMVQGGDTKWGFGEVRPESIADLRRLSEAVQGWWRWDDDAGGKVFVPIDEWLRIYEAHKSASEGAV
jgi:hypothetical protein